MYLFGAEPAKNGLHCGVRVSLQIWDCITYEGVCALTVVDGNSNAQHYIEVIDYLVWPVITRHLPDDNYVLQDDNGPIHRTRVVKEYMEEDIYMERNGQPIVLILIL